MSYTPNSPAIYLAAFEGMLAAMGARAQELNMNYLGYSVTLAAAFSQAVDMAWGTAAHTDLDLQSLRETSGTFWSTRSPPSLAATDPASYRAAAAIAVALARLGTVYVVTQGIDPNADTSGDNFTVDRVTLTPGSPASQVLASLAGGGTLVRAAIKVMAPFDGAPSLRLGSSLTTLLDDTSVDLRAPEQYGSGDMIPIDVSDLLTLTFSPGGASTGKALVIVERAL